MIKNLLCNSKFTSLIDCAIIRWGLKLKILETRIKALKILRYDGKN